MPDAQPQPQPEAEGQAHTGRWTLRDVLALPEDTTHRTELARGHLLTSPRPTPAHQHVSHRLHTLLERSARESGADIEILAAAIPHCWRVDLPPTTPCPQLTTGHLRASTYVDRLHALPRDHHLHLTDPFPVALDLEALARP
ncbi:hypothetical protein ACWEJQ_29170 [Streptomyces albidoflavus]